MTNNYNEVYRFTGTSTAVVATGEGILHNVVIASMGGTTTLTIGASAFAISASAIPQSMAFNCAFKGTLSIAASAAGGDIAVVWSR